MYLLDTDIILYNIKGDDIVKENLLLHYNDPIKISSVTLMELYYGAYKSKKIVSNLAKIKVLEATMDIIPIGQEIVEVFGILKSKLEKAGRPLDDFDLILAPTALSYNLTIVTNNEKYFKRVKELKIENWKNKVCN